jgi:hypothetical protein
MSTVCMRFKEGICTDKQVDAGKVTEEYCQVCRHRKVDTRLLRVQAATQYDQQGRMAFGKHSFTLFSQVPIDYLLWCRQTVDLSKYPMLARHIAAIKDTLDCHERG